jgi:hypothetical protein
MHNIYDIKSICSQNVFISKMQGQKGYLKYNFLSYKPTQKMTCVMYSPWKRTFTLVPLAPLTMFSPK